MSALKAAILSLQRPTHAPFGSGKRSLKMGRKAMPRISYGEKIDAELFRWAQQQQDEYIDSGGVRGHIGDTRFIGGNRLSTMVLLHFTGRKSGRTRIISVGYTRIGLEVAVVASLGGADENPQWYCNIVAGGPLDFQIGTQAFEATWREPSGEEREDAWRWSSEPTRSWERTERQRPGKSRSCCLRQASKYRSSPALTWVSPTKTSGARQPRRPETRNAPSAMRTGHFCY